MIANSPLAGTNKKRATGGVTVPLIDKQAMDALKGRIDLIELAAQYTTLFKKNGKEYAGPCPACGGTDRFYVQQSFFACRGCHEQRGDAIDLVRLACNVGFVEACDILAGGMGNAPRTTGNGQPISKPLPTPKNEPLAAPSELWQREGRQFVYDSQAMLWGKVGLRALNYLRSRGLTDQTIKDAVLGFNPTVKTPAKAAWGIDDSDKPNLWLPAGIVIPWQADGELWRINIRRNRARLGPKYIGPKGFANGLYGIDQIDTAKPVMMVEGEIDALSINQAAGDVITAVATGSTGGSRRPRWIAKLALSPLVLVTFDGESKGRKAAEYWLNILPNSKRWQPVLKDPNDMLIAGVDIRAWAELGIKYGKE